MRALIGLAVLAALALFGLDTFVRNGTLPAGRPAGSTLAAATPAAPRMITRTIAAAEPEATAATATAPVTTFAPAATATVTTAVVSAPTVTAAITPVAPMPKLAESAKTTKSKHAKLACGPGQKRDTVHHKCVARRA